jgi:ankyrin repeat protein
MEEFALKLHASIVEEAESNSSKYDHYASLYVGKEDPLVKAAIEQQRQRDLDNAVATSKRAAFAFTEPYWRKWNSDLTILNDYSAKEIKRQNSRIKPKKVKPKIRTAPDPRVKAHSFGNTTATKLQPNTFRGLQTINFLRECAGKSNKMPSSIDLMWDNEEKVKGGCLAIGVRNKQPPPVTQFCEVPLLDKANKSTLTGGTTVFSKEPRFPSVVKEVAPSSEAGTRAGTAEEKQSRTSTPKELAGISFSTDERFRVKNDSGPGPGEYQVHRMFEDENPFKVELSRAISSSRARSRPGTKGHGASRPPSRPGTAEYTDDMQCVPISPGSGAESRPGSRARAGMKLTALKPMQMVDHAVFAYGCNMHEHAIYGRCLDGMCGKRGQWEHTTLLRNDVDRLTGDKTEYTQQFVDLLPEGATKLAPLHVAAGRGDISALITLSSMGYDINEPEPASQGTPLHLAVNKGNYECVCCILDYFGGTLNIDAQDSHGDTALHIASRAGNVEILKALCDANATVVGILNHQRESIVDLAKSHEIYQILMTAKQRTDLEQELVNLSFQRTQLTEVDTAMYDSSGRRIHTATSGSGSRPGTTPKVIATSKLAESYNAMDAALLSIRQSRNSKRLNDSTEKTPAQKQSYTVGFMSVEPTQMIDSPTKHP